MIIKTLGEEGGYTFYDALKVNIRDEKDYSSPYDIVKHNYCLTAIVLDTDKGGYKTLNVELSYGKYEELLASANAGDIIDLVPPDFTGKHIKFIDE